MEYRKNEHRKLKTVNDEMKLLPIDILSIGKMRWTEIGHIPMTEDHTIYYLRHERQRRKDIAFIVRKGIAIPFPRKKKYASNYSLRHCLPEIRFICLYNLCSWDYLVSE